MSKLVPQWAQTGGSGAAAAPSAASAKSVFSDEVQPKGGHHGRPQGRGPSSRYVAPNTPERERGAFGPGSLPHAAVSAGTFAPLPPRRRDSAPLDVDAPPHVYDREALLRAYNDVAGESDPLATQTLRDLGDPAVPDFMLRDDVQSPMASQPWPERETFFETWRKLKRGGDRGGNAHDRSRATHDAGVTRRGSGDAGRQNDRWQRGVHVETRRRTISAEARQLAPLPSLSATRASAPPSAPAASAYQSDSMFPPQGMGLNAMSLAAFEFERAFHQADRAAASRGGGGQHPQLAPRQAPPARTRQPAARPVGLGGVLDGGGAFFSPSAAGDPGFEDTGDDRLDGALEEGVEVAPDEGELMDEVGIQRSSSLGVPPPPAVAQPPPPVAQRAPPPQMRGQPMASMGRPQQLPHLQPLPPQPLQSAARGPAPRAGPHPQPWFYMDPAGLVQGPFTADEMRAWLAQGFFQNRLPVRYGEVPANAFVPLAEAFTDLRTAFLAPIDLNRVEAERRARMADEQRRGNAEMERRAQLEAAERERRRVEAEEAERQRMAETERQRVQAERRAEETRTVALEEAARREAEIAAAEKKKAEKEHKTAEKKARKEAEKQRVRERAEAEERLAAEAAAAKPAWGGARRAAASRARTHDAGDSSRRGPASTSLAPRARCRRRSASAHDGISYCEDGGRAVGDPDDAAGANSETDPQRPRPRDAPEREEGGRRASARQARDGREGSSRFWRCAQDAHDGSVHPVIDYSPFRSPVVPRCVGHVEGVSSVVLLGDETVRFASSSGGLARVCILVVEQRGDRRDAARISGHLAVRFAFCGRVRRQPRIGSRRVGNARQGPVTSEREV